MGVLLALLTVSPLPADVDEVTVVFGFGDLSGDLVGEVDTLKIDERVAWFHVFRLDDSEGLAQDFLGEGSFNHAVSGVVDHFLSFAL